MPVETRATGPDHGCGRRLYLWHGNSLVTIDSLALPGGNAP